MKKISEIRGRHAYHVYVHSVKKKKYDDYEFIRMYLRIDMFT